MKTLPTLFKLTSTGAVQLWSIGVSGKTIIVNFGQQNGKIQHTEEIIKEGKNFGKSNATTAEEQALAEATAKWESKIKKGYVEELDRAIKGENDIQGGFQPMLAHKFADHGHKIKYPAVIQPKLNGHRCLAIIEDGVASLWSRTRKPITSCPHIVKELEAMYPTGLHHVDGELYNHDYKDNFEDLASLIRQEEPAANCTEVQYYLYDYPVADGHSNITFELRISNLRRKITADNKYVKFTETSTAADEQEVIDMFDKFLKEGYEGAMARNNHSQYVGKRSYDLQKIKEFLDDDFPIVGIRSGRGQYADCGIFICKAPIVGHSESCFCDDCTFDVKMRGPKERLRDFLNDETLWKNKILVVQYQYTSKYGKPIFPVGERFK